MQSSVRTEYNFALEYAKEMAYKKNLPLIVYFGIYTGYPESNLRHLNFLLSGLRETVDTLKQDNIQTFLRINSPEKGAVELGKNASVVVTDCGYLKIQRKWRDYTSENLECPVIQVESDVIVPVKEASLKEEWSAATFRRKINKKIPLYLKDYEIKNYPVKSYKSIQPENFFEDLNITDILSLPEVRKDVKPSKFFHGGYSNAKTVLEKFISDKIECYSEFRNFPEKSCQSSLSPYLHFGQISPLEIALEIINSGFLNPEEFLEQLIVRRELAINYVTYNKNYDTIKGIPDWCKRTLNEHISDKRKILYSVNEMETAETHDPYWNAAQEEMKITGKMHGYMRMYWGKKIIEWSRSPKDAFNTAVYLNNKYSLDGRDPNTYAGIAWCFGKHDRPWKEREIFGKIRYMNDKGLERKFDMSKYVEKVKKYR
ncbi:deoxyribodipyrimidine photo-lyase [Methanomicrobium sp. W14]|uniref:deoxyribodipyrimidine photo-lyase n=1 Tax=Methanomicrobium sp. W14 TaxID=2817839 RepID=UPI001FDA9A02|nr:deoxyribodipyrimidine photo-lyase [Methanomicrobium sp. W14]MBP2132695.1 deoxyribodipyrimidine photo-lyase [Methanomicrobium sp. W14]